MAGVTKIILSTGNTYTIDRDLGNLVKLAVAQGKDHVVIQGSMIKTSAIMEIRDEPGGTINYDQPRLAPPTTELTDEQRQANIERIKSMKRDFLDGRSV